MEYFTMYFQVPDERVKAKGHSVFGSSLQITHISRWNPDSQGQLSDVIGAEAGSISRAV